MYTACSYLTKVARLPSLAFNVWPQKQNPSPITQHPRWPPPLATAQARRAYRRHNGRPILRPPHPGHPFTKMPQCACVLHSVAR